MCNCELSIYQIFLQAVGIVAIAIFVGVRILAAGSVQVDLSGDEPTKKGDH
jgi:hypothetical protein